MTFLNYLDGKISLSSQFDLTGISGAIGNSNQELNIADKDLFFGYSFDKAVAFTTQQVLTGSATIAPITATDYRVYTVPASSTGSARFSSNLRTPQIPDEPIYCTFTASSTQTSATTIQIGLADVNNGTYFNITNGVPSIVFRRLGTNTTILQSAWVGDKLDGTGASGYNINWQQRLTYWIEYVPMQSVRFGVIFNGDKLTCHYATYTVANETILPATWRLPLLFALTQASAIASTARLTVYAASCYTRSLKLTQVGSIKRVGLPTTKTATATTSLIAMRVTEPANIIPIGIQITTNNNTAKFINVSLVRSPTIGGVDNSVFASVADSRVQFDTATTTATFTFVDGQVMAGLLLNNLLTSTLTNLPLEVTGSNQIGINYDQVSDRIYLLASMPTLVATIYQASIIYLEL
jgi:hypothetical protein